MSTTLLQYGVADRFLSWKTLLLSYEVDGIEVHEFSAFRSVSSVKQNQRGGSLRVVSEALEASPVGTKPQAAVDVRISMDGRHDLNAAAPHSIGRAGWAGFNPACRRAIPTHCLCCCCGALRAPARLGACLSACLHGET